MFDGGTEIATGKLLNDGAASTVTFDPIPSSSLRVEIDEVSGSTVNVGLSEIVVMGAPYDSSIPEIG